VNDGKLSLQLGLRQADRVLASADRRFLLGASLRIFLRRYGCGKQICFRYEDLNRLASLADDAEGRQG
jgi:hypothetical protein